MHLGLCQGKMTSPPISLNRRIILDTRIMLRIVNDMLWAACNNVGADLPKKVTSRSVNEPLNGRDIAKEEKR